MKYKVTQNPDDGLWYITDVDGELIVKGGFGTQEEATTKAADMARGNKEASTESVQPTVKPRAAVLSEQLDLSEASMDATTRTISNVKLIAAGRSLNRRNYSEAVLQKSAASFEGIKAYDGHVRGPRKVAEMTGWYTNVRYENGALRADRHFTRTQAGNDVWSVAEDIVAGRAPASLAGLSINATGSVKQTKWDDGDGYEVESISAVDSVDDVTQPAAGGAYLAASDGDALTASLLKTMTYDEFTEARPDFVERLRKEWQTVRQDNALKAAKAEADSVTEALVKAQKLEADAKAERDAALSEADEARRDLAIERALNAVTLPASWKDDLRKSLAEADPGEWVGILDSEKLKATTAGYKPRVPVTGAAAQEQAHTPVKERVDIMPKPTENAASWLTRLATST